MENIHWNWKDWDFSFVYATKICRSVEFSLCCVCVSFCLSYVIDDDGNLTVVDWKSQCLLNANNYSNKALKKEEKKKKKIAYNEQEVAAFDNQNKSVNIIVVIVITCGRLLTSKSIYRLQHNTHTYFTVRQLSECTLDAIFRLLFVYYKLLFSH